MQTFAKQPRRLWLYPSPPIHYPATGATCLAWLLDGTQTLPAAPDVRNDDSPSALHAHAASANLSTEQGRMQPDDLPRLLEADQPLLLRLRRLDAAPYWVVVLRQVAGLYHIADPLLGLRWVPQATLHEQAYTQPHTLTANDWRADPFTTLFYDSLRPRMAALGLSKNEQNTHLASAQSGMAQAAALDAALRMLQPLVERRRVRYGDEAAAVLRNLLEDAPARVPRRYWQLWPQPDGATYTRDAAEVLRITAFPPAEATPADPTPSKGPRWLALVPTVLHPYILQESRGFLLLVALASLLAAGAVFVQAVLLRALLDLGLLLAAPAQRAQVIMLLLGFGLTLLLLKWWMQRATLSIGHRLDARLRMALLALLPGLSPSYPRTLALGDLFERLHSAQALRQMPYYLAEFVQLTALLVLTVIGLLLIDPVVALLACLRLLSIGVASFINQLNTAAQVAVRHHVGRLSRLSLDALLGYVPIRAHSAAAAMRREYDERLAGWGRAFWRQLSLEAWLSGLMQVSAHVLVALILLVYASRQPDLGNWLLVLYWSLSLGSIGFQLLETLFYLRRDHIKIERFTQILDAPSEREAMPTAPADAPSAPAASAAPGVALSLRNVTLTQSEQPVLRDMTLEVAAGEHIAILGRSGAGKSSLMALCLGLQLPDSGTLALDGQPATYDTWRALRARTAWVSADVTLWQRSLLDNLQYGGQVLPVPELIEAADLQDVLESLPQGLQTPLGENGRAISGGQGQRVRFARALQRRDARLVILDEPFRELEPPRRRALLQRARAYWPQATLLYITHTPTLAQGFGRVLVMAEGRIVQDGPPATLATQQAGAYAALLQAYAAAQTDLWEAGTWQHWRLEAGQLVVTDRSTTANDLNKDDNQDG